MKKIKFILSKNTYFHVVFVTLLIASTYSVYANDSLFQFTNKYRIDSIIDTAHLENGEVAFNVHHYHIKDTISTLTIHHYDCTECLDAIVLEGTQYLPDSVFQKIKHMKSTKGNSKYPIGSDIYLTGIKNINEILYGNSNTFLNYGDIIYIVTGKFIDARGLGFVFRVDQYKKHKSTKSQWQNK